MAHSPRAAPARTLGGSPATDSSSLPRHAREFVRRSSPVTDSLTADSPYIPGDSPMADSPAWTHRRALARRLLARPGDSPATNSSSLARHAHRAAVGSPIADSPNANSSDADYPATDSQRGLDTSVADSRFTLTTAKFFIYMIISVHAISLEVYPSVGSISKADHAVAYNPHGDYITIIGIGFGFV
jgi:hypothetical protein